MIFKSTNKLIKYLGIDWGEKRIGLALGDNETCIASPFKVVSGMDEVLEIIKNERIDTVVIGVPFKMSGAGNKISKNFLEFLDLLKNEAKIPVETIDERLTSKAADALAGDKKTKASRDAVAAMVLLQNYLDSL